MSTRSNGQHLSQTWSRVLILGHSFATRLLDFVKGDDKARLDFGLKTCSITILGHGGARVRDIVKRWSEHIADTDPDIIVLLIGDNDLADGTPEEISAHIVSTASLLSRRYKAVVCVGQLFPRFPPHTPNRRWPFQAGYNQAAHAINRILACEIATVDGLRFWHHEFVAFPAVSENKRKRCEAYYLQDGVHLNDSGNFLLYRSIQKLLLHARPRQVGQLAYAAPPLLQATYYNAAPHVITVFTYYDACDYCLINNSNNVSTDT